MRKIVPTDDPWPLRTGELSQRVTSSLHRPERRSCDTPYLAVVDKEGNIASMIQSNYDYFGSGVVVSGMGFPLRNRGKLFVLDANDPDALAPRERPFHTIIPAFMERGDIHVGFGIMGGSNQPLPHAQFVSNFADYGRNIQAPWEAPRFTIPDTGTRAIGCDILVEWRVAPDVFETASTKRPSNESSHALCDEKGTSCTSRL
ncbi:MAG: hypothetical protein DMG56_22255 [Acidobacteria bacterium]|nr:MAG: hypothetical protein DMG56_22255 [Acidobacteriota bacterium]